VQGVADFSHDENIEWKVEQASDFGGNYDSPARQSNHHISLQFLVMQPLTKSLSGILS
jgi:hypothetical protein